MEPEKSIKEYPEFIQRSYERWWRNAQNAVNELLEECLITKETTVADLQKVIEDKLKEVE